MVAAKAGERGKYEELKKMTEKEFKIVEEHNKDFRWLLLYKLLLFVCQNKIDAAVDLLNQALAKSPCLKSEAENLAKYFAEYNKVGKNGNVK